MKDLDVCRECGWHEHGPFRPNECDPERGKIADGLAAHAAREGIASTKLGYGHGRLTFTIDESTSLTVAPHRDGTYSVERFFMIGETLPSEVLDLAKALKQIVGRR